MQTKTNAGAGAPPAGRARALRTAAAEGHPDVRLFRLLEGYWRSELALARVEREEAENPEDPACDQRLELAVRLHCGFARGALSARATTLAGAAAKLQVAASWFRSELPISDAPITHHAEEALISIVDELDALGWFREMAHV